MIKDSPIIGIDLGTTYCCVGYLSSDSHVTIIANQDGGRTTPSYVAFTNNGEIIGSTAKDTVFRIPENVIYDSKRLIGRQFTDNHLQSNLERWTFMVAPAEDNTPLIQVSLNGTTVSYKPHEISAKILKCLKKSAEDDLEKEITEAIITVPAYFNYHQRKATKEAGKLAGLNVLKIINEPTAAALAYIHKNNISDCTNMVVFDLGGGTFDVSILNVYGKIITIRATSGNTHLGGRDFDNNLTNFIMEEIEQIFGPELNNKKILQRISKKCENIKKDLSARHEAYLDFPNLFGDMDFDLKITRESFEKINMDLFERCLLTVQNCLKDAKIDRSEVEKILLIGGSVRIPKLQEMLKEFFPGKELCKGINPDEAVAHGAAIFAANFNKTGKMDANYLITEVTPLSLGTDILGERMSWVLTRNTSIPITKTQTYLTTTDEQTTMCFNIYEGERSLVKYNTKLGTTTITLPPKPPGYAVDVTFEIDEDGILKIKTKTESGLYTSLNIEYKHDFQDVDDILQNATENKLSDNRKWDVISQWSKLMEYCVKMKTICRCNNKGITKEEKEIITNVAEEVVTWLNNNQVEDGSLDETKRIVSQEKKMYKICETIVNKYGYKVKNMSMLEFNKLMD